MTYDCTTKADTVPYQLYCEAVSINERLTRELRDCRNELCVYCGKYKEEYRGACDGCRWKGAF